MNQTTYESFRKGVETAAENWFAARNLPVDTNRPYILTSHASWHSNIILDEVRQYLSREIAARPEQFALHQWIHHGLSSQAMLFNLAGPLIVRNDLAPFESVLTAHGIPWPGKTSVGEFEHEDRDLFNERQRQPTSFDLWLHDGSHRGGVFIESKLVETDFGGCSVAPENCDRQNPIPNFTACYLQRVKERMYWEKMQKHGFLTPPVTGAATCVMDKDYQFFREALFALERGGSYVLLADERNTHFSRNGGRDGHWPRLLAMVPSCHHGRLGMITIQEVFAAIQAAGRHRDWTAEFEDKYGLGIQ